jgi:hypothetical protein
MREGERDEGRGMREERGEGMKKRRRNEERIGMREGGEGRGTRECTEYIKQLITFV